MNFETNPLRHYVAKRAEEEGKNKDIQDFVAMSDPRKEYVEGKTRLDFEHTFSSGEKLVAKEDEEGYASIVLEKNGKIFYDFTQQADFMGCILVTPRFALNHKILGGKEVGRWHAGIIHSPESPRRLEKFLVLGDMRTPENIASLLHEFGHVGQFFDMEKNMQSPEWDIEDQPKQTATEEQTPITEEQQYAIHSSYLERNANARMLQTVRHIRQIYGVNLFEIFDDFQTAKKFIDTQLSHHRYATEFITSLGGKRNKLWQAIKVFKRNEDDKQTAEFLKDLFDKPKH